MYKNEKKVNTRTQRRKKMKGKLLISESIGAVHTHTHTLGHTKEKL